jgi:5-formyltetrahydrofolate cyclo-ligase
LSPGGIREPRADCAVAAVDEIDLVLVPGLGFSRDGVRLGRGRGHYDRFLTGLRPGVPCVGVCFRCQLCDSLPSESHDVPVHGVISE